MYTELVFINRAETLSLPEVVLFQPNIADYQEKAFAWKVIHRCPYGWSHPLIYSRSLQIGISDSYGNHAPLVDAMSGETYQIRDGVLVKSLENLKPGQLTVRNETSLSVSIHVYRSGRILAQKTLGPAQSACFEFEEKLWVKATDRVREGTHFDFRDKHWPAQPFRLDGVRSAQLLMTGGGCGPHAQPFRFHLCHVQKW